MLLSRVAKLRAEDKTDEDLNGKVKNRRMSFEFVGNLLENNFTLIVDQYRRI